MQAEATEAVDLNKESSQTRSLYGLDRAARAIQQLEGEGLVRTQVGQGTFVERAPRKITRTRRDGVIEDLIDRLDGSAVPR